jgi:hypothetical protein
VAENHSAPLPGAVLLTHLPAQAPLATLYKRTGDLFGWLCTAAALLMLALGWRRTPRTRVPPQASGPAPPESLPARPSA